MHRLLVLLLIATLGTGLDAAACDCAVPESPGKAFAASRAVFRGRVVRVNEPRVEQRGDLSVMVEPSVIFEVTKSWKGVTGSRVKIAGDHACDFRGFTEGKEFLVYGYGPPLVVSMCSRTRGTEGVELEMAILDLVAGGGKEETFMPRLSDFLLHDPRPPVRAEAAQLLSHAAPREVAIAAIPALVQAIDDPSPVVRQNVVWAFDSGPFIEIDDNTRTIGRALIKALADGEPEIRRDAARFLWKTWFLPETEPALRAALKREQGLASPNATVITAIASTLATIGSREAKQSVAPLLLEALKSPDHQVRQNAVEKLGKIGRDAVSAVGPIVQALRDSDEYVRYAAAEALGSIGSREAIPALIKSLGDAKLNVQAQAASAIYRIGDDASVQELAVPVLIKALEGERYSLDHVIRVLGEMGPAAYRAVPALVRSLKRSGSSDMGMIVNALGSIGPRAREATPALLDAWGRADEGGRSSIARALEAIDDRSPRVVQAMVAALEDDHAQVRSAAATLLVKWRIAERRELPAGRGVEPLVTELRSKDLETRRQAANMLGLWGPLAKAAVPALIAALSDSDRWVRAFSATALGKIGPDASAAVPALIPMLARNEERDAAIVALGELGEASATTVPRLLPFLKDDRPWTRADAAEALHKIDTPEARAAFEAFATNEVPVLVAWLRDQSRTDRGEAARCLTQYAPRSKEAIEPLVNALDDSDWLTRTKAAEALGALGPLAEAAIPSLARTMNDRNAYARAAATAALERIASPSARRALAEFRRVPE
jgi:HEAT repeat protein